MSTSPNRKICSLDQLLALRESARAAGRTVVHCHGCFDIVHPGHVHHLEYARSLGDLLIVSVSADPQVNKGANRPLIPDDLRMRSLAALEAVDAVYLNTDATAVELLRKLKPDIFVKGREYERSADPRFHAERDVVIASGGRVVFSGGDVVYSSTALIRSLESTRVFDDEKLRRFMDRYSITPESLARRIDSVRRLRCVVVGDFILDRYHFCEPLGMASEAPMMSVRTMQQDEFDGGAAIVAQHLATLGCESTLVTGLAEDDITPAMTGRLEAVGVRVIGETTRKTTVCKDRFLVDDSKVFRCEAGSVSPIDSTQQETLAELIRDAAKNADAVIFTDFGYGLLSAGLVNATLPAIRKAGVFVAADVSGPRGSLAKFTGANLITPTEQEARQAVGDFGNGLGAVVSGLLDRCRCGEAIITLGRQGLVSFEKPHAADANQRLISEYVPALVDRAVDPLGCGDALLATASIARAAGASLAEASLLGAFAAAFEASQLGNIAVRPDALLDLISARWTPAAAMRIAV